MAHKKRDKQKQYDAQVQASLAGQEAGAGPPPKMGRREYEREMKLLHGELVAMQEWVKASGAKVCIVFEGRDTAGKGGTIRRITERGAARGCSGSWPCPPRPSGRSHRCTSSATSRTSPRPARW